MKLEMTENIALGVTDIEAAAKFYTDVLGFDLGRKSEHWTEIKAEPLRIFLCDDDMPYCMALDVDDAQAVADKLIGSGCEKLFESNGEVFVRDPFGTNWCLSPKKQT